MKKITKEWLISAKDDFDIVDEIIDIEHLTHRVAYHCQQAIEKSFKAIIEEHELEFTKSHDLEVLLGKVKDYLHIEINLEYIKKLGELYISSRYPGELGLLPNGKPTVKEVKQIYRFAKEVYEYIFNKLSSNK